MIRGATQVRNSAFPPKAAGYPPPEFRGHTRATARPVPGGLHREQMTSPRRSAQVSPSGPPARSWRRDIACTGPASWPRSKIARGRHGGDSDGRPPLPAPRGPVPGRRRTAGAAPGRLPAPGASGSRTHVAWRSAVAGPARASPLLRCAPLPDGARAASRATPAPQSKTRRGPPGRLSRHTRGTGGARTSSEAILFLAQNWPGCSVVCCSDDSVQPLR
jgi:hypothetical protein